MVHTGNDLVRLSNSAITNNFFFGGGGWWGEGQFKGFDLLNRFSFPTTSFITRDGIGGIIVSKHNLLRYGELVVGRESKTRLDVQSTKPTGRFKTDC
jgi:hypothetical protein